MTADHAALEKTIGHTFADKSLLAEALRHSSSASGVSTPASRASNERMEFLGDRVLGLIVADMLFHRFSDEAEGEIARRLAALVSREALERVAVDLDLGSHVDMVEDQPTPAIQADACEALIAALYLDGGMDAADLFVRARWIPLMDADIHPPKDSKTGLQEWCQARALALPTYRETSREGPSHAPHFTIEASIETGETAIGKGASKRTAERLAAEGLLEKLEDQP